MSSFIPTAHPVLALPTAAEAMAMGAAAWSEAMRRREEIIRKERSDPFQHGWEPPIWKVCDALLGINQRSEVGGQKSEGTAEWQERMRLHLGFKEQVKTLLALGGNRASKSQWAGKRCMGILRAADGKRAWAFHSTEEMSVEYQQPIFHSYLPPEVRGKTIKSERTYIAYKEKTGFTEMKFILPAKVVNEVGSRCSFKTYGQGDGIEGGEIDVGWPDELVGADVVETLELRVATRAGILLITFTPVEGYSDTVALFLEGAAVVKESVAFVCPKDGGPADVARALGLTEEEFAETVRAQKEKRPALYPQSRPERCEKWLEEAPAATAGQVGQEAGKEGDLTAKNAKNAEGDGNPKSEIRNPINAGQLPIPEGRMFEVVPRVMKCADPTRAVVFFHSSDNPYGNPKEVWSRIATKSQDFIKERWCGVATKQQSAVFRVFNGGVHIVAPDGIAPAGTNYQLTDPHGNGRNYFMLWIRSTPEHDYVYREWPGNYWIPNVGVPGAWALPSREAHPDGMKGPGQMGFGLSHWQYKEEIARLEGWPQYDQECPVGMERGEWVKSWDQWSARKEYVFERWIDSRFASVPKEVNDQPVTLLQEMDEIGLTYKPTPGDSVNEGVRDIENALAYDQSKPISFLNKPRLLISADCVNTIFALRVWTGLEKDRGATAEAIGLLRYFYRAKCGYVGDMTGREEEEEEDANVWRT